METSRYMYLTSGSSQNQQLLQLLKGSLNGATANLTPTIIRFFYGITKLTF